MYSVYLSMSTPLNRKTYKVKKGDIVLIPDGDFHRVWNEEEIVTNEDLIFVCVFDGGRNH